jgi:hypothetical protein
MSRDADDGDLSLVRAAVSPWLPHALPERVPTGAIAPPGMPGLGPLGGVPGQRPDGVDAEGVDVVVVAMTRTSAAGSTLLPIDDTSP